MKVLIAGASGYIGSQLSSYLAEAGFQIIAVCNKTVPNDEAWSKKMYRVLQADISSSLITQNLDIDEVDAIINLISLDHHKSNGNPDYVNSVNVSSGWNLLDTFSAKGLKKYIYFSTIHIYGNQLSDDISESCAPQPINKYGLTHLLSEEIANYYAHNTTINCFNIRLSNGYGAPYFLNNNCWDLVVNNLCLGVWKNQQIILKSNGSPLRDFIHLLDVSLGVKQILLNLDSPGSGKQETINFSSGKTISMLDTAMIVKSVYQDRYNTKAMVFINGNEPVNTHSETKTYKYKLNNNKFTNLIGSRELRTMSNGINDIFDFLDKNGNATFS